MSREKNCKWYFGPASGRDEGPNDAMAQNFKEDAPWASLIRESIQNSLDAVYDGSLPVRVEFTFKEINRLQFSNLFELKEHIQGCLDYYNNNQNAKRKFEPMLELFDDKHRIEQTISYIKVSDFNTRGMNYDPSTTDSPFYAFVQAAGVTVKEDTASGGSFGFGKAAYFNISPISTILVSTRTFDNKCFFEGVSALCTHKIKDKKYTSVGFYSNQDEEPISVNDEIPAPFKRDKAGTDVLIMGIKPDKKEDIEAMIEAAIRNFWLAIHSNKLEVVIGDCEINQSSLPSLMKHYFPNEDDSTRNYAENYNPRPFYETVIKANTSLKYKLFKERLPILGNVSLYVQQNKNADDKIAYFRQQKMLIYKKKNGTNYGCYAVFVCEDRNGNTILKSMEPPAHNKWSAKNSDNVVLAKNALIEIEDFIKRTLDSFFELESTTSISITDLEDYLYNEDLSTTESDEVDNSNPFMGNPTGDFDPEGGSIDTDIEEEPSSDTPETKNKDKGTVVITQPGTVTNKGGDTTAGTGHRRKKSITKGGKPGAGKDFTNTNIDPNGGGTYKTYVDVDYRIIAQKENGSLYHYIIIHSDEDIENGEINLMVGSESSDIPISIMESSQGVISTGETKSVNNVISNISLNKGKNTVKVRFGDNMRHSIVLKTYKVKERAKNEN